MKQRRLGKTGWQVGVVGLGCGTHVHDWGFNEERSFTATVERALELGMNFFDTADSYNTEAWLGRALARRRTEVFVATKVGKYAADTGHPLSYRTYQHVVLCCEASLQRLGSDYIDLYQCHLDDLERVDVFLEAFDVLQRRGLVRHFGVSTNELGVLKAFNRDGNCGTCQFDYNLLRRDRERDILPYCVENDVGTIVRRPLEKGVLSGTMRQEQRFTDWVRRRWNSGPEREAFQEKVRLAERYSFLDRPDRPMTQAAITFILEHPAVDCTIPGASRPSRLDAYVAALGAPLTPEEAERILAVGGGWTR